MSTEQVWRGAFKLMEECGELIQVLGKLGPFPSTSHPDGGPPLDVRLEDEIADVIAACVYMVDENNLDSRYIIERAQRKMNQFKQWGLTGYSPEDQP